MLKEEQMPVFERFNSFRDHRKASTCEVSELLTGCIAMFLLRETSRNAINNDRKEPLFSENYYKIFGQRLPHLDTVNDYLLLLNNVKLEDLKAALAAGLTEQKVFYRFRLLGKHYTVDRRQPAPTVISETMKRKPAFGR